ncbi:TRAP transporter small permease [Stutzerimonas sp. VN223-3]|uniref:TRAP transporter small permease n=1 Tax=Stutzerimonas sp. VN223-3 TaxID=3384601 RepID=UPI0038B522B5
MKNTLLRVNDAIYMSCIWIAGMAIVVMSLIIPWGIFARYVLGTGAGWPEPVAILLMVIFTFLGAAASYRAAAHMAVTMFTDRLPEYLHRHVELLVQILMGIICLFMTIWGTKLCMATWNQFMSTLPTLRVGITYSPIPIGGAVTMLFVIERLIFGDQSQRRVVNYELIEDSKEAV